MVWLKTVTQFRATHLLAPNFAFGLMVRKFCRKDCFFGSLKKDGIGKKRSLDLTFFETCDQWPIMETSIGQHHFCRMCIYLLMSLCTPCKFILFIYFEQAFQPYGLSLNPSIIYPAYGLAEHAVFVCSGRHGKSALKRKELKEHNKVDLMPIDAGMISKASTARLLECGSPFHQNVNVFIIDPKSETALNENFSGEIWVHPP